MPEDFKASQIGSSPLPPPFKGLHSPGVRKHCQIIFACYFRKSSIHGMGLPDLCPCHAGTEHVQKTSAAGTRTTRHPRASVPVCGDSSDGEESAVGQPGRPAAIFVPAENRCFQFSHRQGQDGFECTKPNASHHRSPKGESVSGGSARRSSLKGLAERGPSSITPWVA